MILFTIPESVAEDIISRWLRLPDLCRLDSAICQKEARDAYLGIVGHAIFQIFCAGMDTRENAIVSERSTPSIKDKSLYHNKLCNLSIVCLQWLCRRKISVEGYLCITDAIHDDVPITRSVVELFKSIDLGAFDALCTMHPYYPTQRAHTTLMVWKYLVGLLTPKVMRNVRQLLVERCLVDRDGLLTALSYCEMLQKLELRSIKWHYLSQADRTSSSIDDGANSHCFNAQPSGDAYEQYGHIGRYPHLTSIFFSNIDQPIGELLGILLRNCPRLKLLVLEDCSVKNFAENILSDNVGHFSEADDTAASAADTNTSYAYDISPAGCSQIPCGEDSLKEVQNEDVPLDFRVPFMGAELRSICMSYTMLSQKLLQILLEGSPNLTELCVNCCCVSAAGAGEITSWHPLRVLLNAVRSTPSSPPLFSKDCRESLPYTLKHLRVLKLEKASVGTTDELLLELSICFPQLQELNIAGYFTTSGLGGLLAKMKDLKTLEIGMCDLRVPLIEGGSEESLLDSIPPPPAGAGARAGAVAVNDTVNESVQRVWLYDCDLHPPSDQELVWLLRRCPNVTDLDLRNCGFLTTDSLMLLGQLTPCLRRVDLSLANVENVYARDVVEQYAIALELLRFCPCLAELDLGYGYADEAPTLEQAAAESAHDLFLSDLAALAPTIGEASEGLKEQQEPANVSAKAKADSSADANVSAKAKADANRLGEEEVDER